ncbi:hypothetical protein BDA96_03G221300 [Sorghum bicolor]|uniref:TF-B3 domain-containing protein n=2 Tax=Sorghum bicolor TaxID=4558 RepID=A0A921RDA8_SORBI|nr:B3 domain-containing protein Os06g0194400 isoform X1 [Sorghum bicolor]XP_021311550.1 B3 domain-containing protein Os06g0194400 isoform X2 [Sorghum bicolor]EES00990.2 hypothetical protein SORBI_3003G203800 [Sorghum bicolor]KAG0538274.1 hypothetical protein BDA96_03G221300 [Sorghum bicolor]|eukprot:XP_021311549.1 B3 domain-containing protein Os06g0194400 isoform X1 [Sorghum bicolor]
MAEAVAYEEQRRRQIEANKRKLEELQLHHLSATVSEAAAAAVKPSSAKKRKARVPRNATAEPLRRSGRIANLPENEKPVYREDSDEERSDQDSDEERSDQDSDEERSDQDSDEERSYQDSDERRVCRCIPGIPCGYATGYAISKAEELVQKLGSSFHVFTLPMTLFHVTGVFRPGFPTYFCKYLPKRDTMITLVDEEDDKFCMLYQPSKAALSTGWGGFVVDHKLLDGDCLVFQLIERTMFKVYIIRAASYLKASTDEASSF